LGRRRGKDAGDSGLQGERLDVVSEDEPAKPARAERGEDRDARERAARIVPLRERSQPTARRRPPGKRSVAGWLARWALTLSIWLLVALAAVVGYYAYDLPDISSAAALTRRPSVTLLGADGQSFASFGDLYYDVVPVKEMPAYLPEAVLATEDRRFYDHFGVDPFGILRALFHDISSGQMRQGGSTITQQLAKNLFLKPDRTLKRKVQEVLLALWLEHKFTKDEILTIYLNRVYLGSGAFGVEAAARKYFSKSARQLTLYESAVLAGLLKAPSKFNPAANPELTAQRTAQVLQNMVEAGYLTPQQATAAAASRPELREAALAAGRGRYFADWAVDQVRDLLGSVDRDLVVTTTFDPRLQQLAEEALTGELDKEGAKLGIGQGALVVLGPDGAVKAMVGGRDYRQSQFNRAVQALRQPGSAFKPFVYLAGLEAGYGPDTIIDDAPISLGKWHPNNYDDKYYGRIPLREALAHSANSATIQLAEKAGIKHVIDVAHRLGITAELRDDASIALGTSEVSLLELTAAYGGFANGGKGVWPFGVTEIRDRDGHVLYRRSGSGPGQVMTPQQAATMAEMMKGVIAYGTGRAAAIGRPAAGKTGTTQDYRDAWFIGFTPDLVAGVWVGNDDSSPMKRVTGGRTPAQIWHNFMLAALKGTPPHDFGKPPPASSPSVLDQVLQSLLGGPGGGAAGGSASRAMPARSVTDPVYLPGGQFKMNQ
jgi:penicillin-binding protein 1A